MSFLCRVTKHLWSSFPDKSPIQRGRSETARRRSSTESVLLASTKTLVWAASSSSGCGYLLGLLRPLTASLAFVLVDTTNKRLAALRHH